MARLKKHLVEFVVTQTGEQQTKYLRLPLGAKRITGVQVAVTRLLNLPYEATFRLMRRDAADKLAVLRATPLPAFNQPGALAYAVPAGFFNPASNTPQQVELVKDEFVALTVLPSTDPLARFYYAHSVRLGMTTFQDRNGVAVLPLGPPVLLRGATVPGNPLATGDYYLWEFSPALAGRLFVIGLNLLPARFQ